MFGLNPTIVGAGVGISLALLAGAWGLGDIHGHKVKQAELDALKLSYAKAWDAEAARQAATSATSIAGLQSQLAEAGDALTIAQKAIADRQAELAAKPKVRGRGATKEDVNALDR